MQGVITIRVGTDEEREAVARAADDGSLAAVLGVPFEVEVRSQAFAPSGSWNAPAGISWSWLTIGAGGTGPAAGSA